MNIQRWWVMSLISGLLVGTLVALVVVTTLKQPVSLPISAPTAAKLGLYKPQVIGFQPYWLLANNQGQYQPYLTNLTYFGLVVNADGTIQERVKPQELEPGWNKLQSDQVAALLNRAQQDRLETSLLVHLSDEDDIEQLLVQPEQSAQTLVTQILPLMTKHGFTDLNLDIESFSDASPSSRVAFTDFVRHLKSGLNDQGIPSLTLEVTPISLVKTHLIDVPAVAPYVDRVVVMAYDYNYRGSVVSGPVAPVGGVNQVREYDIETTLQEALKIMPAEKIIMGIPNYGYEWETLSATPGAAVIPGTGKTASHQRVTELLANCGAECITVFDPVSQSPVLVLPPTEEGYYQHIFYEDAASLQAKLALAQRYKLGGVAIWALGYEHPSWLEPLAKYKSAGWFR